MLLVVGGFLINDIPKCSSEEYSNMRQNECSSTDRDKKCTLVVVLVLVLFREDER